MANIIKEKHTFILTWYDVLNKEFLNFYATDSFIDLFFCCSKFHFKPSCHICRLVMLLINVRLTCQKRVTNCKQLNPSASLNIRFFWKKIQKIYFTNVCSLKSRLIINDTCLIYDHIIRFMTPESVVLNLLCLQPATSIWYFILLSWHYPLTNIWR
jgi:hypothetical protein